MAEEKEVLAVENDSEDRGTIRIYEVGYHIIPTVAEDAVEKIVGTFRSTIESNGGSFIAEGAPALMKLAYDMEAREGDRKVRHDRSFFGWIKFEAAPAAAEALNEALRTDPQILRHIVFQTVREDTRAKMRAPMIREVKTVAKQPAPRRVEEESAPVSEEDLDKALSDITTE